MLNWLMRALHLDAKSRLIRRQESLSAREFMDLGPEEWAQRRIAARESGAESGPIFLPEGWMYSGLCHYDAVQPQNNKREAHSPNKQPKRLVAPRAT